METIKLDKNIIHKNDIDLIVNYFNCGKVVVLPTDTIYGFHASSQSKKAIKKILRIKKTKTRVGFIYLVNSISMLKKIAVLRAWQIEYIKKNKTKRAVTYIFEKKPGLDLYISSGQSIAVRIIDNKFLSAIIKKLSLPIISTSLNISGEKNLIDIGNIKTIFKDNLPDLAVDAGSLKNKASKIINLMNENEIKIIRR